MRKSFAYQHNIERYRRDTGSLTLVQHGAYRTIMDEFYLTGGFLPNNPSSLYRIAKCQNLAEKRAVDFVVARYWHDRGDGYLTQKYAENELKRISKVASENSEKAKAKWSKNKEVQDLAAEPGQYPLLSTNHSPIDSVSKEDTESPPNPQPEVDDGTEEATRLFNLTAEKIKIPKVQKLSGTRRKHLKARLRDCGGLEGWKVALAKLEAIPAMRGENKQGWKADFDFLVTESKFIKLMEGGYDNWGRNQSASDRNKQGLQEWVDS